MRLVLASILACSALAQNIWTPPVALGSGMFTALASSGTTLHWVYQSGKKNNIHYRRSTDAGHTWSAAVTLGTTSTEIPLDRALATDGQDVYVAYDRNDVLYVRKSADAGSTWGPERALYRGLSGYFFRITIAAAGGVVHLILTNDNSTTFTSTGLFYLRSLDAGATWQPTVQLVPLADQPSRPSLALHGSYVHIIWADERDGNPPCYTNPACPEIYYNRSLDGGTTWEGNRRMTFTGGDTVIRPDVTALDSGEVVLSWQDDHNIDGEEDIYTDHSFDNGATFDGAIQQTFAPRADEHAAIASLGEYVGVSWFSRRSGTEEIYYKQSNDGGVNWGLEQQLTNTSSDSNVPRIVTTTDGSVHIIYVNNGTFFYLRSNLNGTSQ